MANWTRSLMICGGPALAVMAVALASCAERGQRETEHVSVRDSAGVAIVENLTPAWASGAEWRLADRPRLSLGTATDDPHHEFSEIIGVIRLPDSALVVADGSSAELRYFRPNGELSGIVGGRGDGPGEFRRLEAVGVAEGGGVWAYDRGLRRFIVFPDLESSPLVITLEQALPALAVAGQLRDSTYLLIQLVSVELAGEVSSAGLRRNDVPVVRYHHDGSFLDTLGTFPGGEVLYLLEGGEINVWGPPLFYRNSSIATTGTGFFLGDQENFEIGRYDSSGRLEGLIRWPGADQTISDAELSAAIEARVSGDENESREASRIRLTGLPRPPMKPAYGRLLTDSEGNLWVSGHVSPPETEPMNWEVFSERASSQSRGGCWKRRMQSKS